MVRKCRLLCSVSGIIVTPYQSLTSQTVRTLSMLPSNPFFLQQVSERFMVDIEDRDLETVALAYTIHTSNYK